MTLKRRRVPKGTNDADYQALAEFRYQIRKYLDFSDAAAKAQGIEPRQYQLLLAIRGLAGDTEATIGALAEQLRVRHHSAVELVNRAEANQLVVRERIGTQVFVCLTRQGERVLEHAVEERLPELRAAAPALVKALQRLSKARSNKRDG
jgi:DNA-binding MarR family transcriptional regulator